MRTETVKTLIVGGGLSGLCAAYSLGGEAVLLEREDEPGGLCRSFRKDGFVWDCAGHFFHFRDEACRRFFLSLFRPEELVVRQKSCAILYRGALVGYPFQSHIHELSKEELIDCLADLFNRPEKAEPDSFLELLYARYGASITDRFLRPYNEKLYACDLASLDPAAMGRFFPQIGPKEIVRGMKAPLDDSYNSRFFYPKNGAGALIDKLVALLPARCLRTGSRLTALDPDSHTALDSKGRTYSYDRLICTMPLDQLLTLLGEKPEGFSRNKVLALNLGFEQKGPIDRHWLYVPGTEARFYRLGFYDNVIDADRASVYAEIAFPQNASVDAEAEINGALTEMRELGLIQPDNHLLASQALLLDPAYVHIRPQTEERVRAWTEELARRDIHCIGRYGGWRYSSMEDSMREAYALTARLRETKA